ncbi:MAG: hypothetical protein KHY88_11410 [Erysipelotrichaceae bacterium]|nr:hypothetical protein [Erysipelotrichaceae bacterium]
MNLEIKSKYSNKINKDNNKSYVYFNENILHYPIDVGDRKYINLLT